MKLVERVTRLAQDHGAPQYQHRRQDEVGEAAEALAARPVDRPHQPDDVHEKNGEREWLEAEASGHEDGVVRERLETNREEKRSRF